MDNSKEVTCVEWFFGYGGNHLGLKRIIPNMRTIAVCEIEANAIENILAKMEKGYLEPAPIWNDCKTFPGEPFKDRVDLFVASYPCQPFSAAGRRNGSEDPRHLWPYVLKFIECSRPRMCMFENVDGHVSLGLSTVLSDLEEAGYKASWGVFSASEVGAPHQRKRVFILAKRMDGGSDSFENVKLLDLKPEWKDRDLNDASLYSPNGERPLWPARPGEKQYQWEPSRVIQNAKKHSKLVYP